MDEKVHVEPKHPPCQEAVALAREMAAHDQSEKFSWLLCLKELSMSSQFDYIMLAVVFASITLVICDTFDYIDENGPVSSVLNQCFVGVFLMELIIKLVALRRGYFTNPWNVVDFVIILLSFMDDILIVVNSTQQIPALNEKRLRGIKATKALRLLKLARFLPNAQNILSSLYQSSQSMGAIVTLMLLVLLVFAFIFREVYSASDPNRFGTLFKTIVTLFGLLTLDDWSLIYTTSRDNGAPEIIIYLILYILVQVVIFINLVISVLVDNFQLTITRKRASTLQKLHDDYEKERNAILAIRASLEPRESDLGGIDMRKDLEPEDVRSQREMDLVSRYSSIMPVMEQLSQKYKVQSVLLDMLVDTFFEVMTENTQNTE